MNRRIKPPVTWAKGRSNLRNIVLPGTLVGNPAKLYHAVTDLHSRSDGRREASSTWHIYVWILRNTPIPTDVLVRNRCAEHQSRLEWWQEGESLNPLQNGT